MNTLTLPLTTKGGMLILFFYDTSCFREHFIICIMEIPQNPGAQKCALAINRQYLSVDCPI